MEASEDLMSTGDKMGYEDLLATLRYETPETDEERKKREDLDQAQAILSAIGKGISALREICNLSLTDKNEIDCDEEATVENRSQWNMLKNDIHANKKNFFDFIKMMEDLGIGKPKSLREIYSALESNKMTGGNDRAFKTKITKTSFESNTNPTEKQKAAGNYKKGHIRIGKFDVSIENPKGSIRQGIDADGKAWENTMTHHYGYIRGTQGKDGDHIDVFVNENYKDWNEENVYVADQYNSDGSFDEHKAMLGFNKIYEALDGYISNYSEEWKKSHRIEISEVSLEEFEKWIYSSKRKTKAFADYKSIKKEDPKAEDTQPPEASRSKEIEEPIRKLGIIQNIRDMIKRLFSKD